MNPESLLHAVTEQLRAEAKKGPGTMFLVTRAGSFFVTRTPNPVNVDTTITRYDCEEFSKGLSTTQWCNLLKKAWTAHQATQKGGASEQQPAKKP